MRCVLPASPFSLPRRALSAAVLAALISMPALVSAQVTPDPNAGTHRPSTDTAANGTPVVDIVAPSAAGVSHNQYQQFNVDKQGLILNNNAGVSQTQQAGYIAGNPHYQAGQSAKVIVNEVTSTNPTSLRGYTEVAGNAADVIISNPNGISVNGGGFINTPHATLTTGTPVFGGDGSLSAFHVTRGAISIDGDGLNASNIDRLDLIARNLAVNGKAWANNLNVVTGANQVSYADLSTQAIAGEGAAPAVGVDVAQLGGMYANKIRLIGTEVGIGVRNAGQLATQSGDFIIDSAGQLQLTGITASAGDLTLHGSSLANSGTLQASGALSAQTGGAIDNSGSLVSSGAASLNAASLNNSGALQANGITVQATGDLANSGTLYSTGDVNLTAAGTLDNHGTLAAANHATLRAQQLTSQGTLGAGIASDGSLQGSGALNVETAGALAANGRNLAAGSLTLQGTALELSNAQTQAGGDITLTSVAGDINHQHATLTTSGSLVVRSAGAVDNTSGTLQAGSLDAQAAAWRNAYGTVQTTAAMSAQIGGLLDNTHGNWISATNATLRAGSITNNDGTLYAANDLSLTSAGLLQTTGIVYAGQSLVLHAGQLTQSGTLRSDGTQTVQVDGDATLADTTYAGGGSQWQVGGTFTNTGTLAAQNDLAITAGQLASSGTLAAGLQSDGSLTGNAQLSILTQGSLTATGQNAAAGALNFTGSALDLHGATTRAGGDITLTARQGDINHAGADLATNGRLAIQAAQAISNAQGRIQAGQLAVQAGSLINQNGQLLQTGGGDTTLAIDGLLDNRSGTLASNANNITIHAATLDNSAGTLQHAGTGTLTLIADTLTNTQSEIVGNGNLVLASTVTNNDAGTLSMAGDVSLAGTDFSNTAGTVIANALQATLGGTFGNVGGLLQAHRASMDANALINGSGQIKVLDGDLDITANTLANDANGFLGSNQSVNLNVGDLSNAGQIYAGVNLALTAQGDATNSGALQALGNVNATIGGTFTNDNGRLEAGSGQGDASLTLSAGAVSNQAGRIANTDRGDTTLNSNAVNNSGGTLGGQGDVTLNVAQFTNTAGTVVAGQSLSLQANDFSNQGGTLYSAGNLSWNNSSATLDNTGGSIGAGGDIALTLGTVHNNGGDLASNNNVSAAFNVFDGIGRLRAGNDLALTLAGDYTNQAGNTLFANRNFNFTVGGALTNASGATLQSVGALTLNAASFDNQAGADVNSQTTTVNAATQTNEGRLEGDTVVLNAGDVTNTGTVIGNSITINANNLTNGVDLGNQSDNTPYQTALIAAVNDVNLYVTGNVLNRDAMVYALGNITIAADASGARSQSIMNLSGDIEAEGNIYLAANQFTNQRRVLDTETHILSAAEQAQNTQTSTVAVTGATDQDLYDYCTRIYVPHEYACRNLSDINNNDAESANGYIKTTDVVTSITRLLAASAESRLLASGNITLNGSLLNDSSTIAAGRNLTVNGQSGSVDEGSTTIGGETIINRAFTPTATVETTVEKWVAMKYKSGDFGGSWHGDPDMQFFNNVSDQTLAMHGGQPSWITLNPGPALSARLTAGDALTIIGSDIDNTNVGADGRPVNGVGLGSNGSGQNLIGDSGGGAGNVGGNSNPGNLGQVGPAPGSQFVGTPAQPYPVQLPSNGLYTVKPGSGSPYLVETDPRFASYSGFLGSDYLLSHLRLDGDLTLKRLGDAFYETQLVMDQITSLTGRRFLSGDDDALEQYKALMDAGVEEAQQFNLAVGVALTPEQVASLTQDMVWLVSEQVNGESVLVPVVYLSQKTANSVASGAVIQGTTVTLNASNTPANTGTVQAGQDASLKAGNLLNAGHLAAGGNLSVQAAQDLLNIGTIQGGNVQLVAGNHLTSSANAADTPACCSPWQW